jgi:hypothetical protein
MKENAYITGDSENVSCQYCEASVASMPTIEVNF